MIRSTRRGFLVGCSSAIAAMAGARFRSVAFASEPAAEDEILVVLFLRGGIDGLNLVVPRDGHPDRSHYESFRPTLAIPDASLVDLDGSFGLHPSAAPLQGLFQDGKVSIIHATGLPQDIASRSHFHAMDYIELGTPGDRNSESGWLARHLRTAGLPPEVVFPSLALANLSGKGLVGQTSLRGDLSTVTMEDPDTLDLDTGPELWRSAQRVALRNLYEAGDTELHQRGTATLDALDIVDQHVTEEYVPDNGAVYPDGDFGDHLKVVAQMIKLDLGLTTAALDLGGWDTHDSQGDGEYGYFADHLGQLASGLEAFYTDLNGTGADDYTSRLTVVVQSEFGRQLAENASLGTDHGYGAPMVVLSGNALGGLHGTWPGLSTDQLFQGSDVMVTADFRQVLSEILIRRMGNAAIGEIFPGYSGYAPLGFVDGTDLPVDLGGLQLAPLWPMARGLDYEIRVTGAQPGETVHFFANLAGTGNGRCLPAPATLCLDLVDPTLALGSADANAAGEASVVFTVPGQLPELSSVHFQAVAPRGTDLVDSVKSNVVRASVIP